MGELVGCSAPRSEVVYNPARDQSHGAFILWGIPMDPSHQASAQFGRGMAAIIMTVFGFTWIGWGITAARMFAPVPWILFYLATIALMVISVRAMRRGKARMKALAASPAEFWVKNGAQFKRITAFEGVGCGLAVAAALGLHRWDLLAAGISFVVGVHFLPLARLLHFSPYYFTGGAILVCDVASVVLLRGASITISVGIGTGAILWITAIYALVLSHRHAVGGSR